LDADQQDYLSSRLQALPVEQRQDVLAEWSVRCAAGTVRDAAAYLFGLIRKALDGAFRLWAARKVARQEGAAPVKQMSWWILGDIMMGYSTHSRIKARN
jgi:hypothetical protein